jgi:glutamate/aspartate transport system substrate-binding protein
VSTAGSTPLKVVRDANLERGLKLVVIEAQDHAKAVEMVASGEADAFVMDDVLLHGLIAGRTAEPALEVTGKLLSVEPIAIAMPLGDAAFKKLVDDEMRRLIASREAHALFDRWFLQPIPPRDASLKLPMNHLLRDFWKYPTDQVPN